MAETHRTEESCPFYVLSVHPPSRVPLFFVLFLEPSPVHCSLQKKLVLKNGDKIN